MAAFGYNDLYDPSFLMTISEHNVHYTAQWLLRHETQDTVSRHKHHAWSIYDNEPMTCIWPLKMAHESLSLWQEDGTLSRMICLHDRSAGLMIADNDQW